jgi:hypothetical protein
VAIPRSFDFSEARIPDLERLWAVWAGEHDRPEENFRDPGSELLRLLDRTEEEHGWRVLWLIKRLATDAELAEEVLGELAERAPGFREWRARLTLCQIFGATACPSAARAALVPWLRDVCFRDRRVIVRAWAVSALWQIRHDPRYRREVEKISTKAAAETAPSMRARLRRLGAIKE